MARRKGNALSDLLLDYRDSWTSLPGYPGDRARRKAAWRLYGLPTGIALVFVFWHVEVAAAGAFLSAMSVFTALLFGLLFLVFNLAVTIRKDGSAIENAHGLSANIKDLRAIISYTILIAVVLVLILAMVTQFSTYQPAVPFECSAGERGDDVPAPLTDWINEKVEQARCGELYWTWTPILVWFAVHLLLNVISVLTRFRSAFNSVSK